MPLDDGADSDKSAANNDLFWSPKYVTSVYCGHGT